MLDIDIEKLAEKNSSLTKRLLSLKTAHSEGLKKLSHLDTNQADLLVQYEKLKKLTESLQLTAQQKRDQIQQNHKNFQYCLLRKKLISW